MKIYSVNATHWMADYPYTKEPIAYYLDKDKADEHASLINAEEKTYDEYNMPLYDYIKGATVEEIEVIK